MAADTISFARGAPSADIMPAEAVREAAARALASDWERALSYGTGIGHPALCEWIASELHGIDAGQVMVTNGSMEAAALLFRYMVEPGDRVIVEQPSYDRTLLLLGRTGAELIGVPLEADGIDIGGVEAALAWRCSARSSRSSPPSSERAGEAAMTFGPAVGNVGMYVAREMLVSVPEDQRQAYLRMVEEISDLKYQLGVEVARQLPRLLAEHDPERVARYLRQVKEVAATGWKSGVEVAKQLPDLYEAPDATLAEAYVDIVAQATSGPPEDTETAQLAVELDDLERELREMEPKVKRAQELRTQLAARDRRDEKRRKHAVELASALPPILARLRPRYRPPYLEQVRQVAAADPEASLEAADTLLDLLNGERVSPEGAAEWVARGLDVLERNKEVGRGYFRLGSKYSLQVLEELKEGLALKSVARVLKLYATAPWPCCSTAGSRAAWCSCSWPATVPSPCRGTCSGRSRRSRVTTWSSRWSWPGS